MTPALPRFAALPLLITAAAILLTACQPKVPDMTPEETQRIAALTQRMVTRCVGRYLIDLPEDFVLNSQSRTEVEGVQIKAVPMLQQQFETKVGLLKTQYEKKKIPGEDYPYVNKIYPIGTGGIGLIFDRQKTGAILRINRTLELHGWKNGFAFEVSIDATDGSYPELQQDKHYYGRGSDVSQKMDQLLSIYDGVQGRKDTEIPNGPGLCFANGILRGEPREQEKIHIPYHLQNSPDLFFDFNHWSSLREDQSLLERSAQVEQEMNASGTQTLRKGKSEFYGEKYEEWLFSGPTPDRVRGSMFALHGNEKDGSPQRPYIRLTLFNGFRIPAPPRSAEESAHLKDLDKATLSDAEAVALWDKVTPTLRIRPGAF